MDRWGSAKGKIFQKADHVKEFVSLSRDFNKKVKLFRVEQLDGQIEGKCVSLVTFKD